MFSGSGAGVSGDKISRNFDGQRTALPMRTCFGRPPAQLQFASGSPGLCDPEALSARAKTRPILSMPISINQRVTAV
jgi:hypothetical protein